MPVTWVLLLLFVMLLMLLRVTHTSCSRRPRAPHVPPSKTAAGSGLFTSSLLPSLQEWFCPETESFYTAVG